MFEKRATRSPSRRASGPRTGKSAPAGRSRPGLRWVLLLTLGVALTAGAGYLVAALWLFPAPLLPGERQVNRVTGLTESSARAELVREGMTAEVVGSEPHPSLAAGSVVWQDPPPGVTVPKGTMVGLIVSSGLPRVAVPDVRGYDSDLAQKVLQAAGLRVDGIDSVDVKGAAPGLAGGTDPAAGDSVPLGRNIVLHIARP